MGNQYRHIYSHYLHTRLWCRRSSLNWCCLQHITSQRELTAASKLPYTVQMLQVRQLSDVLACCSGLQGLTNAYAFMIESLLVSHPDT